MVSRKTPFSLGSFPFDDDFYFWNLTPMGGALFFSACDLRTGCVLWKTDGSQAGTVPVATVVPPYIGHGRERAVIELQVVGSTLYFATCEEFYACDLWKSDGSTTGTVRITPFDPGRAPDGEVVVPQRYEPPASPRDRFRQLGELARLIPSLSTARIHRGR